MKREKVVEQLQQLEGYKAALMWLLQELEQETRAEEMKAGAIHHDPAPKG